MRPCAGTATGLPIAAALPRRQSEKLAAAGRVGKADGNGVYTYKDDGREPWSGLGACLGTQPSAMDSKTVRDRLLYVQSLEAVRTLEEGVLKRPIDGDVASVLGWGYPAQLGGVFSFIDQTGAANFVRRARELARGVRWPL